MNYSYIFGEVKASKTQHRAQNRYFDFWVLVYVCKGCYYCKTETVSLEIHESELLIVPPYILHEIQMKDFGILSWCHINFDPDSKKFDSEFDDAFKMTGSPAADLQGKIEKMVSLKQTDAVHYRLMTDYILSSIYIKLFDEDKTLTYQSESLWKEAVKNFIQSNVTEKLSINDLSRAFYMSASSFSHKFKKEFNKSPISYIVERKIKQATLLLRQGSNVKQTSNSLGFTDPYYFSKQFKKIIGVSPSEYKINKR